MQEMERGHTQHFSFLTLAHPQPDQSEVAVRFEQAVVSPATQAAALRLSEAEAKRKDEIALDGQSDAELARRDTYLVFYVRDMQTALDGIRQYDSRRAKAAAEKLRVQHARAAYQNHTTRIVGAAGAVLPRVRVRSSLVIPPTRKHSMLSAIVRDPNGMHVRLIEFTRDLVLVRFCCCNFLCWHRHVHFQTYRGLTPNPISLCWWVFCRAKAADCRWGLRGRLSRVGLPGLKVKCGQ